MGTRKKLVPVADLVSRFLADRHGHPARGSGAVALRVVEAFQRIGPPVTEHAEVAYFRAGVIHLTVGESAWLTELSFLERELVERINRSLGRPLVKSLRLRPGALVGRRRPPPPSTPALSATDRAKVASWAGEIRDDALRAAVARAAASSLAHPKPAREPYRGPPGPRLLKPDPIADPPSEDRFRSPKVAPPPVDRWKNKPRRR